MKPPGETPSATPEELERLAREVFRTRGGPNGQVDAREVEIGSFPTGAGQSLVCIKTKTRAGRNIFRFRVMLADPDGDWRPTTWGINLLADALPLLGGLLARALRAELGDRDQAWTRSVSDDGRPRDGAPSAAE